jgi:adenylate kinase family enzyme
MRVLIVGNAGSGKTTMARALVAGAHVVPAPCHLSLDDITWAAVGERLPRAESLARLHGFIDTHLHCVIEGTYGDLIEAALPACNELRFLNPGVAVCLARVAARAWEPDKWSSARAQQAFQPVLLDWIRQYETRLDEFGQARHRALFDTFAGPKREYGAEAIAPNPG